MKSLEQKTADTQHLEASHGHFVTILTNLTFGGFERGKPVTYYSTSYKVRIIADKH